MHQHIKFFFIIFFITHNLFGRVLPSDIIWNENETGYYTIKDNNIILVSTKGKADKTILPSSKINNINIESFNFSKSKNKILLFTKSVKVWRYNTRGDYWVYDFKKDEIQKLGKNMSGSSLMFAKFSPNENFVAYVSKEENENEVRNSSTSANIFLENLESRAIKKLTSSNGTKKTNKWDL